MQTATSWECVSTEKLTWADPPDTASAVRSRPRPTLWSRCRRRTASLACPTHPGWVWPRFCSAARDPTLLVNPPVGWSDTSRATTTPSMVNKQNCIMIIIMFCWFLHFLEPFCKSFQRLNMQKQSSLYSFFASVKLCNYTFFVFSSKNNSNIL